MRLAERTTTNDLLQKSLSKTGAEKAELERKVKELETRMAELEPVVEDVEFEAEAEAG